MERKIFIAILSLAAVILLLLDWETESGTAIYPDHTISVVVHSSPGGESDLWARKVSASMEEHLGKKMVVSNLAGGKGGVAAHMVWNSPHDGYTILGGSETSLVYFVNGVFDQTARAWDFLVCGGAPGVIATLEGSSIDTFPDLLTYARQQGPVSISNAGKGKLWHLKAVLVEEFSRIPVIHTSYNGSNPAVVALLSGEVDAISCSAGEIAPYVESGTVRPLVVTEDYRYEFPGYGEVPAITDYYPDMALYMPMSQILCLLIPGDLPGEVKQKLYSAFEKTMDSEEMDAFARQQNARLIGLCGEEAKKLVLRMENKLSWFIYDHGISDISPEEGGIGRINQ